LVAHPDTRAGLRSAEIVDGGLRLVLNNTLAAVEDGRSRVLDFLSPLALDPLIRNRLQVLFEELVSNTIRHGFAGQSDQSIHVRVEAKPGTIELTFEDDGTPFNPLESEKPEPFSTIETARIGGQGIPLVVKLSTALRYERPAQSEKAGHAFRPHNRTIVSLAM
jgi:anti-sigma regulatory factor (Ser/Thr protein kinase)